MYLTSISDIIFGSKYFHRSLYSFLLWFNSNVYCLPFKSRLGFHSRLVFGSPAFELPKNREFHRKDLLCFILPYLIYDVA